MRDGSRPLLDVAYVQYRDAGGVSARLARALEARGHSVRDLLATGDLERDALRGARRDAARVVLHLGSSALRFGRSALAHRWNTAFAFDVHSARANRLLRALRPAPAVVLQHGALFAPGAPPPYPYVLYCDDTRALATKDGTAGDYGVAWRAREAKVYAGARAVCASSQRTAESLVRDHGVARSRVLTVGVGANLFPERPARVDDGRTILFLADDFAARGGRQVLEAFRVVRSAHRKARLIVAGSSERLALPSGCVHLGPIAAGDVADVLALATLFVLPSPRGTSGIPFLDAMACAVPPIAPRSGALPEIVEDGATGLLVDAASGAGLAEALRALLADVARVRAMGTAARRAVEARFRWDHVASRLESAIAAAARGAATQPVA